MNKSLKHTILLSFGLVLLVGCAKIEMRHKKGMYIGYSNVSGSHYSIPTGLVITDSTYLDTIIVDYKNRNTISFINGILLHESEADPSNYYEEWNGTHSRTIYDLTEENSLSYSFTQSGGGSTYSATFVGMKD